jgi:hypothetical protein
MTDDPGTRNEVRHLTERVGITDTVQVSIGVALWFEWGDIAIEREGTARTAREQMLQADAAGRSIHPAYTAEFHASLAGVAAAAHGLDALYGQLITDDLRATVGPRTAREAKIRECLKARFGTGARNQSWVIEFGWLFDLRDAAVHAPFAQLPSAPHPSGIGVGGSPLVRDYSVESCTRAVNLLLDVLNVCAAHPRPADTAAVTWATSYAPAIRTLSARREPGTASR